jgi:hypothetical protein
VVEKLKDAGISHLRAANRTMPHETQRRDSLRQKALAFLEFARLLTQSSLLAESTSEQNLRFELSLLIESLRDGNQRHKSQIAFRPGSTVYLIAVGIEVPRDADREAAGTHAAAQFVQEILPLTAPLRPGLISQEPVTVWTPETAAKMHGFAGSSAEIDLLLQVLEPDAAAATIETNDPVLFWRWKVRANQEQFSVRLRPFKAQAHHEIELQGAEFIDSQPSLSAQFPELPHFHTQLEPLEIALLIDGYWLAADWGETSNRRTGLETLVDLLDGLDVIENQTKRGMLLHAVICLDTHITPDFRAIYGSLPALYALDDAPIDTTAQFVAEWLEPWANRWKAWEIKPYPVDTDIALEQGFRCLNGLRWQRTTDPAQRALLVVGRSRPHDHARYFPSIAHGQGFDHAFAGESMRGSTGAKAAGESDLPYHPEDRFSVPDIDWREELRDLRRSVDTIVALCDPGLPNPHYHLAANHPLTREYRQFWATIDQRVLLDVDDEHATLRAELGIARVLQTLEMRLFRRREVRYCEPSLTLPFSQPLSHAVAAQS